MQSIEALTQTGIDMKDNCLREYYEYKIDILIIVINKYYKNAQNTSFAFRISKLTSNFINGAYRLLRQLNIVR